MQKSGDGKRRKALYPPFSEQEWGAATRHYVGTAQGLPKAQWEAIDKLAATDEIIRARSNAALESGKAISGAAASGGGAVQGSRRAIHM